MKLTADSEKPSESSLRNLTKFEAKFKLIKTQGDARIAETDMARRSRAAVCDVEAMQQEGKLEASDTYISMAVISQNIERGAPPRLGYLKGANRVAIFEPKSTQTNPALNLDLVMSEFTRVMTYEGWEVDYMRWMDASEVHGISWVEVMWDDKDRKDDGCVSVNYIANEYFYYDKELMDIQDCPAISVVFPLTDLSFRKLAKSMKFDEELTKKILKDAQSKEDERRILLHRVMFKEDGFVWVGWFKEGESKWVKEPEKFFNGIWKQQVEAVPLVPPAMTSVATKTSWVRVYETAYPFFPMRRQILEDPTFNAILGRAVTDFPIQDAISGLTSALVNGTRLATNVMWAPDGAMTEDNQATARQVDQKIGPGRIWNRPMKAFNSPYPDPMLSTVIEQLQTTNAESAGNIAYAVNNRADSRKTATEIQTANQQNQMLSSVQILMLSLALRPVYTAAWRIVRSSALKGYITFCAGPDGLNDVGILSAEYIIKPAGDTDFVEMQTQLSHLQQDAAQLAQTPVGPFLLRKYLEQRYPKMKAEIGQYLDQMTPANPAAQQLSVIGNLLKTAVMLPDGNFNPLLFGKGMPMHGKEKLLQQEAMKTQQILAAGAKGTNYGQQPQQ